MNISLTTQNFKLHVKTFEMFQRIADVQESKNFEVYIFTVFTPGSFGTFLNKFRSQDLKNGNLYSSLVLFSCERTL